MTQPAKKLSVILILEREHRQKYKQAAFPDGGVKILWAKNTNFLKEIREKSLFNCKCHMDPKNKQKRSKHIKG